MQQFELYQKTGALKNFRIGHNMIVTKNPDFKIEKKCSC